MAVNHVITVGKHSYTYIFKPRNYKILELDGYIKEYVYHT